MHIQGGWGESPSLCVCLYPPYLAMWGLTVEAFFKRLFQISFFLIAFSYYKLLSILFFF